MPVALVHPRRWRLATRVLATVLVLLAVLLGLAVATFGQANGALRDAEIRHAAEIAQALATSVDAFASDIESTTLAVAIGLAGQSGPLNQQTVGANLLTLSDEYQVLRALFLTDVDGRVIASANGVGIGVDISARPYLRSLREGATTVWGPGVRGLESGGITLTFGRAVKTSSGIVRGYLVAAMQPPALVDRLRLNIAPDLDVTLIDTDGLILHSTTRPDIPFERRDVSRSPHVQVALEGNVARLAESTSLFDGEARYGALVPVPRTDWVLAATRPLAPLDRQLQSRLLAQVAGTTLAVLLAALVVAIMTARIARPLRDLADSAGAITRGERLSVSTVSDDSDIVQLASAMQLMSAAIVEREDALGRALALAEAAEQEVRAHADRLSVLSDASRAFAEAGAEQQETLDAIARHMAELVGNGCILSLVSTDRRLLIPEAVHHARPEALEFVCDVLASVQMRFDRGFMGRAFETGVTLIVPVLDPETLSDALGPQFLPYMGRFGTHSLIAAPLRAHGNVIGGMIVWRDALGDSFTEADRVLVEDLADRAGLSVERAQLHQAAREQVAAEAALNVALRGAIQVRDEFLALVSHDLKNPLTTVRAAVQLILRRVERDETIEPSRLVASLNAILAAAKRLTAQIDGLLDVACIQTGMPLDLHRRPVDLVQLVRSCAEEQQYGTEMHVIRVHSAVDAMVGAWDVARLERVLGNVLENAIKYSPDGGDIAIDVTQEEDDGQPWAIVTVRDQGIGIPANNLPHIFDRFHRGENAVGRIPGTGIGLSGVKQIVEDHGGVVEVGSIEGQGSTFTIRLPLERDGETPLT